MSLWLDALAGPWLDALFVASVQFALVASIAALLDRTLLRAASPKARLALWLAVLAPLALPLRPRVATFDIELATWESPVAEEPLILTESDAHAPRLTKAESRPSAQRGRRATVPPVVPARLTRTARPSALPAAPADPTPVRSAPSTSHDTSIPWRHGLAIAWMLGVLTLLARALRGELRFRRLLAEAAPVDDRVRGLVADAARIAGLRGAPATVRSDAVGSPAVHGALRPRLVVPDVGDLADDELLAVLVHECFHVRRRDLLWMPLVSLLRAIWWFHPLVPHAARSLADALEEARDADALEALDRAASPLPIDPSSGPSPARLAYARVLVRFAERRAATGDPSPDPPALAPGAIPLTRDGRGLRRRVAMIVSHPSPDRFAAVGGAVLAVAVLGIGLVRAGAEPPSASGDRGKSRTPNADGVHVERQAPLPEWRSDLDARLARRLESVGLTETPVTEALLAVGTLFDLPLAVDKGAIYDEGDPEVDVALSNVSAAEVLDVLCLSVDGLAWSVVSGEVHVGHADSIPYETDLRFYRVQPVLEARGIEEPEDLISFVVDFSSAGDGEHRFPDSWEMEGWSMHMWRGLLAVRTTEDTHRSVEAVLERLLVAQERPSREEEPWRARLESALDAQVAVEWEDVECSEALAALSMQIGASVLHPFEHPDDYGNVFSVHENEVRVRDLFERIASDQERYVEIADGSVVLTPLRSVETRLHSIGALLELVEGEGNDLMSELDEFTHGIDSASWDDDPRCVAYRIGDMLAVRQSAEVQDQISALLAQLERALGGS